MKEPLLFVFSILIIGLFTISVVKRKEEQVYQETMPCQSPKKEGDSTTGKLVRKPDGTLWLMCSYTNYRSDLKHTM